MKVLRIILIVGAILSITWCTQIDSVVTEVDIVEVVMTSRDDGYPRWHGVTKDGSVKWVSPNIKAGDTIIDRSPGNGTFIAILLVIVLIVLFGFTFMENEDLY